jgi:hypothetical protein
MSIELKHTLDFKLFVVEKNGTLRCLDSDMLIQRIIHEMAKSGFKFSRL